MSEPGPFCVTCGYSLANIARAGLCPECATPVVRSLSVRHLRDSSPEYLLAVRRGVYLQIGAILAVVGASALRSAATNPAAERAVAIIDLVCSLVGVLGAWFISSADPARAADERFGTLLSRCRAWALTDACVQCVGAFVAMFVSGPGSPTVAGISQLPAFGTQLYVAKIFHDLGVRAQDTNLPRSANKLVNVNFWMLGGSIAMLLEPLLPKAILGFASPGLDVLMLVVGVWFLICYVRSFIDILRCLRVVIAYARAADSPGA